MAERRMFAKSIVLSDAFLDMPLSARCLYFTLGMMADDDGFVGSPKAIMRQCGASQDDLLLLLQKRYVLGFDSGVIVIKHWRMNNYLQNDRRKPTTYLEELAQLTIDGKGAYTEAEKSECIQNVYKMYTQDSIDKNSIVKDSIISTTISQDIDTSSDIQNSEHTVNTISSEFDEIIAQFNSICLSLPKVSKLTETRKKAIKARLKDYSVEDLIALFERAEASDFLSGRSKQWTGCSFDWLLKPGNLIKVLEGNYDNKGKPSGSYIDAINNRYNVVDEWLERRNAKND